MHVNSSCFSDERIIESDLYPQNNIFSHRIEVILTVNKLLSSFFPIASVSLPSMSNVFIANQADQNAHHLFKTVLWMEEYKNNTIEKVEKGLDQKWIEQIHNLNIASTYLDAGKVDEALVILHSIFVENPLLVAEKLLFIYFQLKNYEQMRSVIRNSSVLKSNNPRIKAYSCHAQDNVLIGSFLTLLRLFEENKNDLIIRSLLANMFVRQKEVKEAYDLFEDIDHLPFLDSIKTESETFGAYTWAFLIYAYDTTVSKNTFALKLLEKVLKLQPFHFCADNLQILIYKKLGRENEALKIVRNMFTKGNIHLYLLKQLLLNLHSQGNIKEILFICINLDNKLLCDNLVILLHLRALVETSPTSNCIYNTASMLSFNYLETPIADEERFFLLEPYHENRNFAKIAAQISNECIQILSTQNNIMSLDTIQLLQDRARDIEIADDFFY